MNATEQNEPENRNRRRPGMGAARNQPPRKAMAAMGCNGAAVEYDRQATGLKA